MRARQRNPQALAHTITTRHWDLISNAPIHGVRRTKVVFARSGPERTVVTDTVAAWTLSRAFALFTALVLMALLAFLLAGCSAARPLKGGGSSSVITRPGQTNQATLKQPENPNEASRQTVQSQRTLEYVLPAGTAISLEDGTAKASQQAPIAPRSSTSDPPVALRTQTRQPQSPTSPPGSLALLAEPMPVRVSATDRTETSIGAAQKDAAREWAAKAASVQPVMWAGIIMMTVVAGVLAYFGWWTKAGLAVAVGVAMIVLAQTLPAHGTLILLAGLGVFALAALLVLYAYYKGQLDQNHNGIPDFLEPRSPSPAAKA